MLPAVSNHLVNGLKDLEWIALCVLFFDDLIEKAAWCAGVAGNTAHLGYLG